MIRMPYELDPHSHLYDYDLPEHYIILNDWSEKTTGEIFALEFHSTGRNEPSTILVNGGYYYCHFSFFSTQLFQGVLC